MDIDIPFGYFRNEIYRNFIRRNKPIEELFAPNIRGKEFQKEVDDFLEFYNKTAKDGTWDKDDILLGVRGSQDRHLYRVMHSSIELKKIMRILEHFC